MFKKPCILLTIGLTAAFIVYGLIKDSFVFVTQTKFDTAITLLFLPQMFVAGSFARLVNLCQFPFSISGPVKIIVITALTFFASLSHAWIIIGIWNKFHRKKVIISTAPILLTITLAFIAGVFLTVSILIQARAQARMIACNQNLRSLVQMFHFYAMDYDEHFPPNFEALNMAGYEIGNLTSCPAARGGADYGFNTAATMDCPPDTPLVGDFDSNNHGCGGWVGDVVGYRRWHPGIYSAGSGPLENVSPEDWVRQ